MFHNKLKLYYIIRLSLISFADNNRAYGQEYNLSMKRATDLLLIVGFLVVDVLFFHDLFKPGEHTALPQILTGLLSLIVIYRSAQSIIQDQIKHKKIAN